MLKELLSIESLYKDVTGKRITAAKAAIPNTKPKRRRRNVPWWSEECSEVIGPFPCL